MAPTGDRKKLFDEMLWPHLRAAYNVARWLVRNDHDAEDIVQESFVKAFLALDRMRGGDSRVWLLAIVRNTALSLLRRRGSDAPATRDQAPDAIEGLPGEFRETIVLRELEGLSYKDIAAVLDVPVGTVMSRLARARKMLLQALTPERTER